MSEQTFAVVDVETTGFNAARNDRVAEVAVVTLDRTGEIIGRWETLINPGRDLGAQHIHGIRAADILDAPTFAEAAPELAHQLKGSVLVAHNLSFDSRFLAHEFDRAGWPLPEPFMRGLCTMQLARNYVLGNARSLGHCCEFLSVDVGNAHSAGDDAEAAAGLLQRYMDMDPDRPEWDAALRTAGGIAWQGFPARTEFLPVLRPAAGRVEKHFLSRITAHMPEFTGPAEHDQYLALLDRAMLDLHLSTTESRGLVALADELSISRHRCVELHRYYLTELITAAWIDGVITPGEEQDLRTVGAILGLPDEDVSAQLASPPQLIDPSAVRPDNRPAAGEVIVLTGQMTRERGELRELLEAIGYRVDSNVTKKTNLVIAADPDSLSGKAAKARKYGVPLARESYLYDVLGIPAQ